MACSLSARGTLPLLLFGVILKFSQAISPISPITCGTGKGCFNTTSLTCLPMATWAVNGKYIHIELSRKLDATALKDPQWVAMGLNPDKQKMSPSSVIGCVYNPSNKGQAAVSISHNSHHSNEKLDIPNGLIKNLEVGVINNSVVCRFDQLTIPKTGSNKNIYRLDEDYFMLLGCGPANADNSLKFHGVPVPMTSQEKVNMSTASAINGTAGDCDSAVDCGMARRMVMAHGMMMLIGWWVLLANGILFARYFKYAFPKLELGKLKFWFHVHRNVNVIAVVMIVTALILILVVKQRFLTNVKHAIVGIIAIILSFIQPFIAVMRCGHDSPNRVFFNWIHRTIGLSAWALASTAILLACVEDRVQFFQSTKNSHMEVQTRNIMIGYLVVVGVVVLTLEILDYLDTAKKDNVVNYSVEGDKIQNNTTKITTLKTLVVVLFICLAIGLVAFLCVQITRSDYISPTLRT